MKSIWKLLLVPSVMQIASSALARELQPGLYEIEVQVRLPNINDVLTTKKVTRCITAKDIEERKAFSILSNNPLAKCPLSPFRSGHDQAGFYVDCPGRNTAKAFAKFEIFGTSFKGTITMNMGGKNMTAIERQKGDRIGVCAN